MKNKARCLKTDQIAIRSSGAVCGIGPCEIGVTLGERVQCDCKQAATRAGGFLLVIHRWIVIFSPNNTPLEHICATFLDHITIQGDTCGRIRRPL